MSTPPPQAPGHAEARHLVLYDGVCGLCNRLNVFLLPRDTRGVFAFASLQSATGKALVRRFGKDAEDLTTFYVVTNYRSATPALLAKSRAALFVLTTLGGPWKLIGVLRVLPAALLDVAYDAIARRRYRFFGRSETCLLPAPRYKDRFIDL